LTNSEAFLANSTPFSKPSSNFLCSSVALSIFLSIWSGIASYSTGTGLLKNFGYLMSLDFPQPILFFTEMIQVLFYF